MVVENRFSSQYAPAREERQVFIISYNRKKQNERKLEEIRARARGHSVLLSRIVPKSPRYAPACLESLIILALQ